MATTADRVRVNRTRDCIQMLTALPQIMILIQLVLDGVPGSELKTESTNPMLDARAIFIAATRIAKCA